MGTPRPAIQAQGLMLMAHLGVPQAETSAEPLAQQQLCGRIWLRFGDRNLRERLAPLSKASSAGLSRLSCPWVGLRLGWVGGCPTFGRMSLG